MNSDLAKMNTSTERSLRYLLSYNFVIFREKGHMAQWLLMNMCYNLDPLFQGHQWKKKKAH